MKSVQIAIVLCIICFAVPSISAEWTHIPYTDWWFDSASKLKVNNSGVVDAWIKKVYLPSSLEKIKAINRGQRDYNNYSHSIDLYKINCDDNMSAVQVYKDYNLDGTLIFSDNRNEPLEPVTPGTVNDEIVKTVCSHATKK